MMWLCAQVFEGKAKALLCDFHRLQAQWRWINDSKHDVPAERCVIVLVVIVSLCICIDNTKPMYSHTCS